MNKIKNIETFVVGHAVGLNPAGTIEQLVRENMNLNLTALIEGFDQGRRDLIEYNGQDSISNPPLHVLDLKAVSDFMFNGMLDINIDEDEYNETQLRHIREWFSRGEKQRNQDWELQIGILLQKNGLSLLE